MPRCSSGITRRQRIRGESARTLSQARISLELRSMEVLRSRLGNIETVETKKTLGFHSAETLTPEASCEKIAAGVKSAMGRLRDFKPYILKTPITLELSFKNYLPAEVLSYLRTVQRVDSHTIRFVGKDMAELTDFLA